MIKVLSHGSTPQNGQEKIGNNSINILNELLKEKKMLDKTLNLQVGVELVDVTLQLRKIGDVKFILKSPRNSNCTVDLAGHIQLLVV